MQPMNIGGKTALVTGSAKRIGRIIALALAREGVNIVLTYRTSQEAAAQTEGELREGGVETMRVQVDLSDITACDDLIGKATARFGKVDILVNSASDFERTDLEEWSKDVDRFRGKFDYLARLHIGSPLYLGMRLGLLMKKNGWGRIVNITDRVTVKGQAYRNWGLYLATKYGLHGVTQALAVELSPEVTVNSVAPGLALPPEQFSEQQLEAMRKRIPLRKEAGPDEIAADVLYLIQSDSKTGTVILTDGGASLLTY